MGAGVGLRGVSMFLADSVPVSASKAGLLASWPRSSRGWRRWRLGTGPYIYVKPHVSCMTPVAAGLCCTCIVLKYMLCVIYALCIRLQYY